MGCLREGLRSKGRAVDHQPGKKVDGYSLPDHQKRDLQVSKKGSWFSRGLETDKGGSKQEGLAKGSMPWECCVYTCIVHMLTRINEPCV
jgi:hypothetical protein